MDGSTFARKKTSFTFEPLMTPIGFLECVPPGTSLVTRPIQTKAQMPLVAGRTCPPSFSSSLLSLSFLSLAEDSRNDMSGPLIVTDMSRGENGDMTFRPVVVLEPLLSSIRISCGGGKRPYCRRPLLSRFFFAPLFSLRLLVIPCALKEGGRESM